MAQTFYTLHEKLEHRRELAWDQSLQFSEVTLGRYQGCVTSWSAGKFKLLINYVTNLISEPPSVHFIALIPLVTMQMQIELNNWLSVDG